MKKILNTVLILIFLVSFVPTFVSAKVVPNFDATQLRQDKALIQYLFGQVEMRSPEIQIKFHNSRKKDFKMITDYLTQLILYDSNSDVHQVNISSTYFVGVSQVRIKLDYRMTKDEYLDVMAWIREVMDPFLAGNPPDEKKIRFINDTIVRKAEYDQTYQKRSAYNMVHDETALCEGYAYLGRLMLNYAKIENLLIIGKAKNTDHIWNMVKYRGKWYHLDFTWNDPVVVGGVKDKNEVSYEYYLRSDASMSKTHSWKKEDYPSADADLQQTN